MTQLPKGTVTFLFTDIEGSTRLLEHLGERYADVLTEHHRLLRAAFRGKGGVEVETQGDALFVAFPRAGDAVLAAVEAQRAITTRLWPEDVALRVRMGLHTGEAFKAHTGYIGIDVHRAARICAAAHGGQILLSENTRDLIVDASPEGIALRDLGVHRLKDLTRPLHLFQVTAESLPVEFPALRSLDAHPHNLPVQLTSFIGRGEEKVEVRGLLRTTRLITLTGAGGAGKTRLAIQVGAEMLDDFPDGIWFVDLAPLVDATLIPQAVAAALNVREASGRPLLDSLADYLKPRRLLLILDNCEHLVSACADLAAHLLRSSPGLHFLVTSRQPLHLAGEMIWYVPPMSFPHGNGEAKSDPMGYDAIRLFIERARLVNRGFVLNDHTVLSVVEICRRLEGLPLPIELAAARTRALSVQEILNRLDDQFRLLATTLRGIPDRHLTHRTAIDWSYNLLTLQEQSLFTRTTVFRGGFTLEAATAVCAGDGSLSDGMLHVLSSLVDKSMVTVDESAAEGVRYRLLEPLREYGWERLLTAGEAQDLQTAHAHYFADLAERAAPEMTGAKQSLWLDRLDAERHNLRAAMDWWMSRNGAVQALRVALALGQFWFVRGYFTEGRNRLSEILGLDNLQSGSLNRARGLAALGRLSWGQGDLAEAKRLHEEALAISTRVNDRKGIAFSLNGLALVARAQGDSQRARPMYEEALAINRELNDRAAVALNLQNIGILLIGQGEYEAARARFQEKLTIERESGNTYGIALALHGLGSIATDQGDYASARTFYEESLTLRRQMSDKTGIAGSLHDLGNLASLQGDYAEAHRLQEEYLTLSREVGNRIGIMNALADLGETALREGDLATSRSRLRESLETARELDARSGVTRALEDLAILAVEDRQPERALRLGGAAAVLREGAGTHLPPATAAEHARAFHQTRIALGPEAGEAAWSAGRNLTLEQAVAYALAPATAESGELQQLNRPGR